VVLTKAQAHEKEAKPLIPDDIEEIEVWAGSTTAKTDYRRLSQTAFRVTVIAQGTPTKL